MAVVLYCASAFFSGTFDIAEMSYNAKFFSLLLWLGVSTILSGVYIQENNLFKN